MRSFEDLFDLAAARKGGRDVFAATLPNPKSPDELAAVSDDRWLSHLSRFVFSAGFNWKVIANKWPRFEEVFDHFDPARMAMMSDDDLDGYLKAEGIVRHAKKILSIRDNAIFVRSLVADKGSVGEAIGRWPPDDFSGLLWMLKSKASRLGGTTAMYALRDIGMDGYILSGDVVRALVREGVVDKAPSGRKDLQAVQQAFNAWRGTAGRPLTHISRVLACSIE